MEDAADFVHGGVEVGAAGGAADDADADAFAQAEGVAADVDVGVLGLDRFQGFGDVALAGVPRIMQAMFEGLVHTLSGGDPVLSRAVSAEAREGDIAESLEAIQHQHPNVDLGSYPFGLGERIGVCIVGRSTNLADLNTAMDKVTQIFQALGLDTSESDPAATN